MDERMTGLGRLMLEPTTFAVDIVPATHEYVPTTYEFTGDELKSLFRWVESQYLPYDDLEIRKVVDKISRIVNGLAKDVRSST